MSKKKLVPALAAAKTADCEAIFPQPHLTRIFSAKTGLGMPHSQQDLVQIVANGGSLDLKVGLRSQQDLVQIAANAGGKDVRIILREVGRKSAAELVQIAANAPGRVTFAFDD
jgi:hypothetical protein